MTDEEKKVIVENYVSAYNDFDVAGMLANLHEEVVFKNVSGGAVTHETAGIDAFRDQAKQAAGFFSERQQMIENFVFSEDGCEIDIAYSAKLAADLPNGLKAGETISLKGKSIFRFEENKIREIQDLS